MRDTPPKPSFLMLSAKARVFLALGILVAIAVAVSLVMHWRSQHAGQAAMVNVTGGPGIASIPGAGNPSSAYVKAQVDANLQGESAAIKAGTAYVPTITRPDFVGNPDQFAPNTTDVVKPNCPINKVVVMYKPNPASCTLKNLQLAHESGVTADELTCQGCSCPVLKEAGYSIGDLKRMGLSATQLRSCGFNLQDLMDAGFDSSDLKAAGFTTAQLKNAGFTAGELKAAGTTTDDLQANGYTPDQINDAGYGAAQVKSTKAQCSLDTLKKDQTAGVSAAQLRQEGCDLSALKTAGYSAAALRNAGYSAGQLKDAGFSANQLKDAGFSAGALKNAGYSANALKSAGFSANQLKNAGFSAGQLVGAGFTPSELRSAGFTAGQLRHAGVTAAELRDAGFSPAELKDAGFSRGDLSRAGVNLIDAGYPTSAPSIATTDATSNDAVLPSINDNSPEARLAILEKQQQSEMNRQQQEDSINRMENYMNQQTQRLLVEWSNFTAQVMQKAPVKQKNESGDDANGPSGTGGKNAADNPNGGPILKAGTILFAEIDTSINSDEGTPILATVVAGQLNGSKLIGSFSRKHKSLLISFTLVNDPRYPSTIPINAVAIDPNTARTAISGQVNSHYLLRYGTLFASAFVQGISQGILNQGVTTSNCLVGNFGCSVTQIPLNSSQQLLVGLGQVGQAYAQHMGQNFNRPPTIRIGAGTGIGVLLMSDLTLPSKTLPATKPVKDSFNNRGDQY